jgi:hypothetical protein
VTASGIWLEHLITTNTTATSNPTSTGTDDNAAVMVALQEYLVPSALFAGTLI